MWDKIFMVKQISRMKELVYERYGQIKLMILPQIKIFPEEDW